MRESAPSGENLNKARPITVIGRDASGKVVAEESFTDRGKAEQVASYWRGSGFEVEVTAAAELASSGAVA